jgi:peptide-N4-(N-acetyl-beta-glucosaminyl)asparagine amidase
MYESGWGKKLNFVISLHEMGFTDVTPRYSRQLDQVMERRNIDEATFAQVLKRWTKECRKSLPQDYRQELLLRDQDEEKELVNFSKETLECRELKEQEKKGRQSGSLLWRQARGEHE